MMVMDALLATIVNEGEQLLTLTERPAEIN